MVSGVLPLITNWHNDNEHTREVFVDIPGPLKVAFYTVIPVMLAWGAFRFADRMKNWERGKPAPTRRTTLSRTPSAASATSASASTCAPCCATRPPA